MKHIPLTSPDIRDNDIEEVARVLKTGMLVQGQEVFRLESEIATYLNSKSVKALSNGTATMHLALKVLGVGPGDEVIVPAFSYVATANVVELVGATPIFVDVELSTFNIDVNKIEQAITTKTKAIIPVHEFGLACDIEKIVLLAKKHNIYVIEDAACALGATQNAKKVGTFGHFGSFSLHPRKAITSGEGGLLTMQNEELAQKINTIRNHGVEMIDGVMEFVEAGFNYRMTDFQAALVSSQLMRFEETLKKKQNLADVYYKNIKNSDIQLPFLPEDRPHTWQTFHVLLSGNLDRDEVISQLKEKGVGTNYGAQCIPAQKFYKNKYNLNSELDYPNAYLAYTKGLALPIYEKLKETDIEYISSLINNLSKKNDT